MRKILFFLLALIVLSQCSKKSFVILSASENKTLEPILKDFGSNNSVHITMKYMGSVDIMLELQKGNLNYDAVWPANSLWISLGDKKHQIKDVKSIMTSPVVFGIKKSIAQKLGFVNKEVYVKDILKAVNEGKLKFMMTSATQSNSGATAYLGFLYALSGNPPILTNEHLHDTALKQKIRTLFSGINRGSGSSGWLKTLFLSANYDAMVNYEAVIIETNQELLKNGKEPLYLVYPKDGLALADSPLGFVKKSQSEKEEIFKNLQEYLLTKKIQKKILKLGRRTGFGGSISQADKSVFNPDWGIDSSRVLSFIKIPSSDVIFEALNLYQTEFRKPSITVFCLDFSGSMGQSGGHLQLKKAMGILLKKQKAQRYMLQPSSDDKTIVVLFSNRILDVWEVNGNNEKELNKLYHKIKATAPIGGTDIYSPVIWGLKRIAKENLKKYVPSIILMTDGKSSSEKMNFRNLAAEWTKYYGKGYDIPVFPILFGDAEKVQLEEIQKLTKGRLFDGRKNLIHAFRKVKGYN